jgi:hypothetical protein
MTRIVRIIRMMTGAGATANARRACHELGAQRRYGDELAAYLAERHPRGDSSRDERRRPA